MKTLKNLSAAEVDLMITYFFRCCKYRPYMTKSQFNAEIYKKIMDRRERLGIKNNRVSGN